jgi:hypothetical protein
MASDSKAADLDSGAITDGLPDVRDGLTRLERIILVVLREIEEERGNRAASTAMVYGRVVERIVVDPGTFQAALDRLVGKRYPGPPR